MYGNNIVWDTQNGSSVYDGQYRLIFFLLSSSVWVTNYFYVALFYKIFFEDRHLFSLNHVLCVTILYI